MAPRRAEVGILHGPYVAVDDMGASIKLRGSSLGCP